MPTPTADPLAGTLDITDVLSAHEFNLPCEHPEHATKRDKHAGDAAWVQHFNCRKCGDHGPMLVCDKYRQRISFCASTNYPLVCGVCKTRASAADVTFTKL